MYTLAIIEERKGRRYPKIKIPMPSNQGHEAAARHAKIIRQMHEEQKP
ncbi:MAG: hypothetical protein IJ104_03845 [Methanobrevibacter sp.]|nr:hypothetical protein [Methanobrevibacter sp.]